MKIDSQENKQKILNHFLKLCVFDGWNDQTLRNSVAKSDIEEKFTELIFENGAKDIADFFIKQTDDEMLQRIKSLNIEDLKVRDKIKTLIKTRLEINSDNKLAIKQLIKFYSNPKKFLYAIKNNYQTADSIWYLAKDQSTDYNFYSKRIILSKIYAKTLMFFVDDNSVNSQKSWDFLDSQIEKIMKFSKFKKKAQDLSKNLTKESMKESLKKLPFIRLIR